MYPGFTQYNKPANLTSRSGPLCAGHGEGCRWSCSSSRKRPINDLLNWNALMSARPFKCRWGCDKRLNLNFLVGVRTVSWNQVLAIFTETVSEGLHNWWPQWRLNPINDLASPPGFGQSSLIMVCCRFVAGLRKWFAQVGAAYLVNHVRPQTRGQVTATSIGTIWFLIKGVS